MNELHTMPSRESARVLTALSITAAVAVAGQYYIQPLLDTISHDFVVSAGIAGLLVTAAQTGFLLGIAFVVPLGDRIQHRTLLPALLVFSAVMLAAAAMAPGFWSLGVLLVAVGVGASAAQVAVPLAAALVPASHAGRATAKVMTGLLIGILLARTVSGVVAGIFSWRAIFGIAAAVELVLAAILWWKIPPTSPTSELRYGALLASIGRLVRSSKILRSRMLLGALSMCGFSIMWTSLAFLLGGTGSTGYHFSEPAIGAFGLAGAAGALGAPLVGRLADRGRARLAATAAWVIAIVGWGLSAWGTSSIVALVAGLLVFDLGVQAIQLSNQHAIYSAHPDARSRVTTAYMSAYFAGAVLGSVVSGFTYQFGGWLAVCSVGGAVALIGLLLWAFISRGGSPRL